MRNPRRNNGNRQKNNLYQYYLLSYKKFRTAIYIYYFLVLYGIFTIVSHYKDLPLLFEYGKINKTIQLMNFIEIGSEFCQGISDVQLKEIPDFIRNAKPLIDSLEFPGDHNPFIYKDDQEGKYLRNRRTLLESLSKKIFGNVKPIIKKYMYEDSTYIRNQIKFYGHEYEVISGDKIGFTDAESWPIADSLRRVMVSVINGKIIELYDELVYDPLILPYAKAIENDLKSIDSSEQEKLIKELKEVYIEKNRKLIEIGFQKVVDVPYFKTLSRWQLFILLLVSYYVFPFIIPLFYINYRIYEHQITLKEKSKFKIPSIMNIISLIGLNKNKWLSIIFQFIALPFFIFIFPVVFGSIIIFWVLNKTCICWVILILFYVLFYTILKFSKTDNHELSFYIFNKSA